MPQLIKRIRKGSGHGPVLELAAPGQGGQPTGHYPHHALTCPVKPPCPPAATHELCHTARRKTTQETAPVRQGGHAPHDPVRHRLGGKRHVPGLKRGLSPFLLSRNGVSGKSGAVQWGILDDL